MLRERFFSILNIAGLAVGSACVILIYLYVSDEFSYDKFHKNGENIYRVNMTNIWIQSNDFFGSTGPGVAEAIKTNVPEAREVIRLHYPYYGSSQLIVLDTDKGKKTFDESDILATDPNFFDVFTIEPLQGDISTALDEPNSVILDETTANNYFGQTDVVGRQFSIGDGEDRLSVLVKAVVKDLPQQSHFSFNILISMNSFPNIQRRAETWWWTTFVTYVMLDENSDPRQVQSKLSTLPSQYLDQEDVERLNWTLRLQPLFDVYLGSNQINNRLGPVGNMQNTLVFSMVAFLILLLSCANFMNLSTARYAERAKEIGIQKVLGSTTSNMRWQFLMEALLFALMGVIIGLGLAELLKGEFNALSGKDLSINIFERIDLLLIIFGLVIGMGFLAGAYPAWFLTRFKTVEVLKGKVRQTGNMGFRNLMIIFQFSISIALISTTFLIRDQLSFLTNKDLGFDEEHVLAIDHLEWLGTDADALKRNLSTNAQFRNVSFTNAVPPNAWNQDIARPMGSEVKELSVTMLNADHEFLPALDLTLLAGRNFFESGEGDHKSVILNEASAHAMGFMNPGDDPDEVIGKKLKYSGEEEFTVIGLLKDFNIWNVQYTIEPIAIFHAEAPMWKPDRNFLILKLNGETKEDYEQSIATVKEEWNEVSGGLPFYYFFVDDEFDNSFSAEMKFGKVIDIATFLAVFIAVLGLIGLISYTTEQRSKEFSIRKILGASIGQLIKLITWDFLKLLLISMVVGALAGFWFGNKWLEDFTLSIGISPINFVVATAITLCLVLIINTIIVIFNANKNPANTLRNE